MVLQIGDKFVDGKIDLPNLYSRHPELVSTGAKFASIPCRSLQGSDGVLYIRQKENVVTFYGDKFDDGKTVKKLGTQDVLTCHVVTLHHPETGVTAFAHFDEYLERYERYDTLEAFLDKFQRLVIHRTYYGYQDDDYDNNDNWEWYDDYDENYEEADENDSDNIDEELFSSITLQLVGGLKEESGKGGVLSKRILSFFATHHLTFKLTLACLGPVNTRPSRGPAQPIVGGVLCDLTKNECRLYPATFNRSFLADLPEDSITTLMLGPALIKKPERLKKMIYEQEDKGFSAKNNRAL